MPSYQLKQNKENSESHCEQYFVKFESQTWTFRETGLPYNFSDHKLTTLAIHGEIRFCDKQSFVGRDALDIKASIRNL